MIPNVRCDRCALQVMNPMTDKLAQYGMDNCTYSPDCSTCNDGFHCFSNYHSCANVRITGTLPRCDIIVFLLLLLFYCLLTRDRSQ